MGTLFGMFPFLKTLFADGGYRGPKFASGLEKVLPNLNVEIVKRSDTAIGFKIVPKRWIVERTIAWLNRCEGWPRIGKISTARHLRSCALLQFASCSESYAIRHDLSGPTLRRQVKELPAPVACLRRNGSLTPRSGHGDCEPDRALHAGWRHAGLAVLDFKDCGQVDAPGLDNFFRYSQIKHNWFMNRV
jgi:transposase